MAVLVLGGVAPARADVVEGVTLRYKFSTGQTLQLSPSAPADPLPVSGEVKWPAFRQDCQRAIQSLDRLGSPWPPSIAEQLKALLVEHPKDAAGQAIKVQEVLDRYCLVAMSINAESRVKAMRGPAAAKLPLDRALGVLMKISNEAGITPAVRLTGPEIIGAGAKSSHRWLEATLVHRGGAAKHLTGERVEYLVLRLTARSAGKREALLKFDVGQGTQELGFRAEVPILFTVRKP